MPSALILQKLCLAYLLTHKQIVFFSAFTGLLGWTFPVHGSTSEWQRQMRKAFINADKSLVCRRSATPYFGISGARPSAIPPFRISGFK